MKLILDLDCEADDLDTIKEYIEYVLADPELDVVFNGLAIHDDSPRIDPKWFELPAAGSQRQKVLLALCEGGKTRDELCVELERSNSSIDPRVQELEFGGFIYQTTERRETRLGKLGHVLKMTEKARIKLNCAPKAWFPDNERISAD